MRKIEMVNGEVWGHKVSEEGLKCGKLDYLTLSKMIGDAILNNYLINYEVDSWDLVNGDIEEDDEIYQYYIITPNGAEILEEYTDELVWYNEELDVYLWGITHFGTGWSYVLTDIELVEVGK